jgi:hypothetical protein
MPDEQISLEMFQGYINTYPATSSSFTHIAIFHLPKIRNTFGWFHGLFVVAIILTTSPPISETAGGKRTLRKKDVYAVYYGNLNSKQFVCWKNEVYSSRFSHLKVEKN